MISTSTQNWCVALDEKSEPNFSQQYDRPYCIRCIKRVTNKHINHSPKNTCNGTMAEIVNNDQCTRSRNNSTFNRNHKSHFNGNRIVIVTVFLLTISFEAHHSVRGDQPGNHCKQILLSFDHTIFKPIYTIINWPSLLIMMVKRNRINHTTIFSLCVFQIDCNINSNNTKVGNMQFSQIQYDAENCNCKIDVWHNLEPNITRTNGIYWEKWVIYMLHKKKWNRKYFVWILSIIFICDSFDTVFISTEIRTHRINFW